MIEVSYKPPASWIRYVIVPIPGDPGMVGVKVMLLPLTVYDPPIAEITGLVTARLIVPTPLMSSSFANGEIVIGVALSVSTVSGLANGARLAGIAVQAAGII